VGGFYPANLLFVVLPLGVAAKAWLILHLLAGVLGFYSFARHLGASRMAASVAGVFWGLSGVTISLVGFLGAYSAMGCLPWLAVAVRAAVLDPSRRKVSLLAGVAGLLILTSVPEWIFYGAVLSTGLALDVFLSRKEEGGDNRVRRVAPAAAGLALAAVLAGCLAAPTIAASVKTAYESVRGPGGGTNLTFASQMALPRARWIELFGDNLVADWAKSSSDKVKDYPYLPSLTPGAAAWGLAIMGVLLGGRAALGPAVLSVVGFLLAVGPATPFFKWACWVLPPLQALRFPEKHFVLTGFCLVWLAILGLKALSRRLPERALVATVTLALVLTVLEKGPMARGLLGSLRADILTVEPPVLANVPAASGDTVRPRIYQRDSHDPVPVFDRNDLAQSGWWSRASIQPGFASLFGRGYIFEFDYDLSLPGEVFEWTKLLQRVVPSKDPLAEELVRNVGAVGICSIEATGDGRWRPRMRLIPDPLSPFRFAGGVERNPNGMQLFQSFLSQGADANTAYVAEGPPGFTTVASGRVLAIKDRADGLFLDVEVDQPGPGFLMLFRLRQSVEEAFIDGQPLATSPMGFGFAGASIPAGRHRLLFRPVTRWVKLGGMVSVATLILMGYLWVSGRPRPSSDAGATPC
jgi:hypothetical protein